MSHPFIVLEGLSAVGKTTVGQLLSHRLGARFYVTPPEPYRAVRAVIDSASDLRARYLFYVSGLFHASREIRRVRRSRPVVCDRYVLTTECFHRAAGLIIPFCHLTLPLEGPSLHILITAPEPTRNQRLEARGLSFNDRREQGDGLAWRLLAQYRRHALTEIDNGTDTPENAVRRILTLVGDGGTAMPRPCLPEAGAERSGSRGPRMSEAAPSRRVLKRRVKMNRRAIISVLLIAGVTAGCAGGPLTTRERATLGGAVLGAGTGAIIGNAVGNPRAGALIGAGIGAVTGAAVGDAIQGAERQPLPPAPPPPPAPPLPPAAPSGLPVQVPGAGDPTSGAFVNGTPWRVAIEVGSLSFTMLPGETRPAFLDVGSHRMRARAEVDTHFGPRVVGHVDRPITVDPRAAGWSLRLSQWDFR